MLYIVTEGRNKKMLGSALVPLLSLLLWSCESPGNEGKISYFGSMREKSSKKASAIEGETSTNISKSSENTWRMSIHPLTAFSLISKTLAKDYIIARADKKSLSVTTEWDKFFINGKLFRNKLSATVFPLSLTSTEIVIKNTIEYYAATDNENTGVNDNYWVPSQDITNEVTKIVQQLTKQAQLLARSNSVE